MCQLTLESVQLHHKPPCFCLFQAWIQSAEGKGKDMGTKPKDPERALAAVFWALKTMEWLPEIHCGTHTIL